MVVGCCAGDEGGEGGDVVQEPGVIGALLDGGEKLEHDVGVVVGGPGETGITPEWGGLEKLVLLRSGEDR